MCTKYVSAHFNILITLIIFQFLVRKFRELLWLVGSVFKWNPIVPKTEKKPKIKKGKIIIFKEDNRVKTSNSLDRITNHIHRIG